MGFLINGGKIFEMLKKIIHRDILRVIPLVFLKPFPKLFWLKFSHFIHFKASISIEHPFIFITAVFIVTLGC